MHVRPFVAWLLVAVAAGCDAERDAPRQPGVHVAPIINGNAAPNRRAIGALVLAEFPYDHSAPAAPERLRSTLCTATLIAPRWVLTAAHCLDDHHIGFIRFITARDIRPIITEPGATPHTARAIIQAIVHPDYQRGGVHVPMHADIALLRLASPITTIPPIPLATAAPAVPVNAVIVGFGIFDTDGNIGERRSARTVLDRATEWAVMSAAMDSGAPGEFGNICFGDSGGAVLVDMNGRETLVGVHSMERCVDDDCTLPLVTRCSTGGIHVRVDAFRAWIDDTFSRDTLDCRVDRTLCPCEAACSWTDGGCSPVDCRYDNCADGLACAESCADATDVVACHRQCEERMVTSALDILHRIQVCERMHCPDVAPDARPGCLEEQCSELLETCNDHVEITPGMNCQETMTCMDACNDGDWICKLSCLDYATPRDRELWWSLEHCTAAACAGVDDEALPACRAAHCAEPLTLCLDRARPLCDILGGDCGIGFACGMEFDGVARCKPSDDIPVGAACEDDFGQDHVQCADGSTCWSTTMMDAGAGQMSREWACAPWCRVDADCGHGAFCHDLFSDSAGVCIEDAPGSWTDTPAPSPVCDAPGQPPCNPAPVEPGPDVPTVTPPARDACSGGGSTGWLFGVLLFLWFRLGAMRRRGHHESACRGL